MTINKESLLNEEFVKYFDKIPLYYRNNHTKIELENFIKDYQLENIKLKDFLEFVNKNIYYFLVFDVNTINSTHDFIYEDLIKRLNKFNELIFDENDNLIQMNNTKFKYNRHNNLINTTILNTKDQTHINEFIFQYDHNQNLIDKLDCVSLKNTKYKYDKFNRLIYEAELDNNNSLEKEIKYIFNEDNILTFKTSYYHHFKYIIEEYYNEDNGLILYSRGLNKNKIQEELVSYIYNENNNLIEIINENINNKTFSKIYEYDKNNNIVYTSNKNGAYKLLYNENNQLQYAFHSQDKINFNLCFEYIYNKDYKLTNVIDVIMNIKSIIDFKNLKLDFIKDYEYEKEVDNFFNFEENLELDKK